MNKILLILLLAVVSANLVNAANLDIVIKNNFSLGETIFFNYSISSNVEQNITYMASTSCPNAPRGLLKQRKVDLKKDIFFNDTYIDITIDETIEPQTCTAYVEILSPIQQREEKTFEIIADPSFSFNLELDKTVFVLDETIELSYTSEVDGPSITATLTSPSGKFKDIKIPSKLKLDDIGTYTINVEASKLGYKTMQVSKQIGIIEQEANIKGKSDSVKITEAKESRLWLWIIAAIIALAITFFIYMKIRNDY